MTGAASSPAAAVRAAADPHPEQGVLAALAGARPVLAQDAPPGAFAAAGGPDDGARVLVVDDVERLDAARQEALFHLFNRVLARAELALVCAGERPPLALPVREDRRTRLGLALLHI